MEQSPFSAEDVSDGIETKDSKKKKKAEALGAMLITEPRPEAEEQKRANIFDQLTRRERVEQKGEDDSSDVSPEADADIEPELETVSAEESHHIERELVEAMQAEAPVEAEATAETAPEEVAAIEAFRARIIEQDMDSEAALQETLNDLEREDATEDSTGEEDPAEPNEIILDHTSTSGGETEPDNEAEEADEPPATTGGSGGAVPPPPIERGEPSRDDDHGRPAFGGGSGAAAVPTPIIHTPKPAEYVPQYDEGNAAGAALMGGIIGYLIGRRRGRIKTEKKLLPIQKKLEKQVDNLQWQLKEKETKIRQTVREQQYQQRQAGRQLERAKSETRAEQPVRTNEVEADSRVAAKEAGGLHGRRQSREHLGQVLVLASAEAIPKDIERPGARKPEVREQKKSVPAEKLATEKQVLTMNRTELLKLSEKIIVDGSSLRQIYETHLVGEHGLRRLVTEHLRGGDVKKVLRREIVEREIDFERDPVMRDLPGGTGGSGAASKSPALHTLLQKAGADVTPEREDETVIRARAAFEEKQEQQKRQQQRTVDVVLAGTILLLLAVVVAVLFFR